MVSNMAMKVSREEFLGVDAPLKPSFDNVAAKMALDFEAEVFLRLKKLGLKRKDLAERLGVSPAAVSKLLAENSNMTLKTMAKVAVALGCEVSSIRLTEIGDVDYAGLDDENDTVLVPREKPVVEPFDGAFSTGALVSRSTSASFGVKEVPVLSLGRIAA